MEEKIKNKSNTALIVVIVVLLIAVLGLSGYIFLNKNSSNSTKYVVGSKDTNSKNESSQNDAGTKTNSIITFDGSKSINSSEKDYTLSCQGNAGIFITVDSTQKVLTFQFTPTKVVENYGLTWTSSNNSLSINEINFEKKIIDVFFGGMGQDSSGDTVFILLEDGTVEYIPIVHMFNHVQGAPVSYGKINGVTDVTKFTLASNSSGVTTLALRSDGTFYDLWYALKDTGNY